MRVFLDGQEVEATAVEPGKHVFVGTFRPPSPPVGDYLVQCRCGRILQTIEQCFSHWQIGHFDVPTYKTV